MVGTWEDLPAARVPAPLAPHVLAMYGYSAASQADGPSPANSRKSRTRCDWS
jgi:hypothetical protein